MPTLEWKEVPGRESPEQMLVLTDTERVEFEKSLHTLSARLDTSNSGCTDFSTARLVEISRALVCDYRVWHGTKSVDGGVLAVRTDSSTFGEQVEAPYLGVRAVMQSDEFHQVGVYADADGSLKGVSIINDANCAFVVRLPGGSFYLTVHSEHPRLIERTVNEVHRALFEVPVATPES